MSISVRKSIRWLPEPASEPTSTLVLTSPRYSYFVDLRALDHSIPPSLTVPLSQFTPVSTRAVVNHDESILDWAFAGTSESNVGTSSNSAIATTASASQHDSSQDSVNASGAVADSEAAAAGTKSSRRPSSGAYSADHKKERRRSTEQHNGDASPHQPRRNSHKRRHARWMHWVDSRTDRPQEIVDEADVEEDGHEGVERGRMINPDTGAMQAYEEVWRDMPVLATIPAEKKQRSGSDAAQSGARAPTDGKGQRSPSSSAAKSSEKSESKSPESPSAGLAHVSLVLMAENEALGTRGMVVRVGQWCQGILRSGGETSCERWWCQSIPRPEGGGGSAAAATGATGVSVASAEHSRWECVLRVGKGSLPCQVLWERESLSEGEEIRSGGLAWRCVERSIWS